MKDSKQILEQFEPKTDLSQNSSAIPAGPHKPELSTHQKSALASAINEAFELLRINYQHLYFSAYPELNAVNSAKRLWLDSLAPFNPETVLHATHELMKQSDFLPTISRLLRKCLELSHAIHLPTAYNAYIEACNAPSPKKNYPWSHPVVYYAGKKSHWYFLMNTSESLAFPVFKSNYESYCEQVLAGASLPPIEPLALNETIETPLSKDENASRLAAMRANLDI